jgi:anaerobic magnesium-protoporphyrin IX monomethyl ester cyclase
MRFSLVAVENGSQEYNINKDLNGGLGTKDTFGQSSFLVSILSRTRKNRFKIPVVSFAYLQAIFENKNYQVHYHEGTLPDNQDSWEPDCILIYGSIVDFKHENECAKIIKQRFPLAKVGFFGPFPSRFPEHFQSSDFVIGGEAEGFFQSEFHSLQQLTGVVKVNHSTDLDSLPTPSFSGFPVQRYSYFPALIKKPFVSLVASKGCPYSCRSYCTYGEFQGEAVRTRSPKKVVDDMKKLQREHGIMAIQFRDPTFGLKKGYIENFCLEIKRQELSIDWGIETRLDLLTKENIKHMHSCGLRNINIGIETNSDYIAKVNDRKLINSDYQEEVIRYCANLKINISAFYILGLESETEETIKSTIDYAIKLDTPLARFSIATPYPGTQFYDQLAKEDRIIESDLEKYTQFDLVFLHANFDNHKLRKWLAKAYKRYYFRPKKILYMTKRYLNLILNKKT